MLEERIDVALQPDTAVTSADLAALIEEAEADIVKADQGWMVDQTPSLDPRAARHAKLDATLAANRLRPLVPKLQARYQEVHYQEQATAWLAEREAAWLAEHDALKQERDALAEELPEVYPDAVRKIADLFVRIAANDRALAELNRARPAGMEQHLVSAELHARGRNNFSRDTPSCHCRRRCHTRRHCHRGRSRRIRDRCAHLRVRRRCGRRARIATGP